MDDVHLLLNPVIVGGGTRALPEHLRLSLDLVDTTRFAGGVVHLHYRVRAPRRQAVPTQEVLGAFSDLPAMDVEQFRADQDRYIDPAAY